MATSLAPAVSAQPVDPRTVLSGLEFPTGIAFDSDGTMFVNERAGRISMLRPGSAMLREITIIPTMTAGETGLLGIAVAPEETALFVFITALTGDENQVYRVPLDGSREQLVVDGLPASHYHNGGGVAFGDDGMLFVSNGEIHDGARSQDPDALGGKVYRLTPEGDIPRDNPFGDSPAYAIGLRNPFGLAIDPVTGAPFVTENGPSGNDEVNRIDAGGNYGWPEVEGSTGNEAGAYDEPLLDYPEAIVPTGIAFADPATALPRYGGDLFFAAYSEQTIHHVELDASRQRALSDRILLESDEPIVALAWGPEGLYFSTPTAIKVLPLARPNRHTPRAQITVPRRPEPPQEDQTGATARPFVLLVLLGALLFGMLRLRRH